MQSEISPNLKQLHKQLILTIQDAGAALSVLIQTGACLPSLQCSQSKGQKVTPESQFELHNRAQEICTELLTITELPEELKAIYRDVFYKLLVSEMELEVTAYAQMIMKLKKQAV